MANMQIAIRLWRESRQDLVESLTSGKRLERGGLSSNSAGAFWPWQRPPLAKSVSILTATGCRIVLVCSTAAGVPLFQEAPAVRCLLHRLTAGRLPVSILQVHECMRSPPLWSRWMPPE